LVGIFPNDAAITLLVSSQLLEQQEEGQLERRRYFSQATMARIPEPEETLELTDADPSAQPDKPDQLKGSSYSHDLHRTARLLGCTFSDQGSSWMNGAVQ
jgi:hypothetical protein